MSQHDAYFKSCQAFGREIQWSNETQDYDSGEWYLYPFADLFQWQTVKKKHVWVNLVSFVER